MISCSPLKIQDDHSLKVATRQPFLSGTLSIMTRPEMFMLGNSRPSFTLATTAVFLKSASKEVLEKRHM